MKKVLLLALITLSAISFAVLPSQEQIVSEHIQSIYKEKGYAPSYIITNKVKSSGNVTIFYGKQTINNIPIYKTEFNIAIKDFVIASINHKFILNAESLIQSYNYRLTPSEALQRVIPHKLTSFLTVTYKDDKECIFIDSELSERPIKVRSLWVILGKNGFPAYDVSIYNKDHKHWFNTRINGIKGEVVDQNDWVAHCNLTHLSHDVSSSKHLTNSPLMPELNSSTRAMSTASYRVFAFPLESPNHGNRSIVSSPEDAQASPFGWHDTDGSAGEEYTITRGNNVFASEDKNDLNVPGYSPNGGSTLTFDHNFDITKSHELHLDAAITNLFYWNNMMHDVWWHYGFDEESGNFQSNNYGNGGLGGDYVQADAQDGSGTNNANFATPPDGDNPRMQMYIWKSGSSGDYFSVNTPNSIKGKYNANVANFGPALTSIPVTGKLVLVDDGTPNGDQGCNTLINGSGLAGNIALIRRKGCNFSVKVENAQDAGAIAVVIYSDDNDPIVMGGTSAGITIPSVHISQTDGLAIRNVMEVQDVNVSLYDSSDVSATTFDSDFDNGVIAHEYGHGISTRLTGGAANSSCLSNEEQMGEGWSDFFSLVMTHQPNDSANKLRGIGTYVVDMPTNGRGIRNYPYSADITRSPYSYDDIKSFSVPHGVGSVWCSMLWDLYWVMIDKYGYDSDIYNGTGGNNKTMQLVIDGMKLQPCNPGFTDARDAIIQADKNANGGDNELLIWSAFSRRGLGYSAVQGSSDDRSDGSEGFDIPPYLKNKLQLKKTAAENSVNGAELMYTLALYNKTGKTIGNIQINDTLRKEVSLVTASLKCGTASNGVITVFIDSIAPGDSFICTFKVIPNFANASSIVWEDYVENGIGDWKINSSGIGVDWKIVNLTISNAVWKATNAEVSTDLYLEHGYDLTTYKAPSFSFRHWINSEDGWDGGVIEIQTDGSTWFDAGPYFTKNGYNKVIQSNPASAISGRDAFTGNSGGFIESTVDLSSFSGNQISVRFRFASDGAAAVDGWYIDDFRLIDAVTLKNTMNVSYGDNDLDESSVVTFIVPGKSNSIQPLSKSKLKIYPNPSKSKVNIEAEVNDKFSFTLCDIQGKILISQDAIGKGLIDVSGLSNGIYMLNLELNGIPSVHKLIIN
jgi:extracellular elastinolytic metalloproteinase